MSNDLPSGVWQAYRWLLSFVVLICLIGALLGRMADLLAGRAAEGNDSTSAQVERMYELALQRQPRSEELEPAVRFVEGHGLPALARVLFNTNEFLFSE